MATRSGFALLEVLVAMSIIGVVFVALYSGLTYGFTRIQLSRENLRATQILMEKMETIRLYNWDQITDPNMIPTNFTASYYPAAGTNQGVLYTGTFSIEDPGFTANYNDKMRRITVTLNWQTGSVHRQRSLSTLVTENGLYDYVYQEHYH